MCSISDVYKFIVLNNDTMILFPAKNIYAQAIIFNTSFILSSSSFPSFSHTPWRGRSHMRKLSKVILFSQLGIYFSPVREVISTPFWVAIHRYDISNRQEFDGRLPFLPHNSFQMRSGYMNLAPITCAPRTGKIIGTIGSCMDFDACESINGWLLAF